jgi:hypothetical protein
VELIYFCEKCTLRIPRGETQEDAFTHVDGGLAVCRRCKPLTHARKSDLRGTVPPPSKRAGVPRPTSRSARTSSPLPIIVGGGVALALVVGGILVSLTGQNPVQPKTGKARTIPTASARLKPVGKPTRTVKVAPKKEAEPAVTVIANSGAEKNDQPETSAEPPSATLIKPANNTKVIEGEKGPI